jgi:hypothetical protein
MTDDIPDNVDLKWDLREELARIDQMLRPEHDRKRQEILWYPIVVVISGRFQLNGGPAKMTDDIPDNVDLKWIARQLIELHGELCGFREGVGSGEESLRGEFNKLRQSLDNWARSCAASRTTLRPISRSHRRAGRRWRGMVGK